MGIAPPFSFADPGRARNRQGLRLFTTCAFVAVDRRGEGRRLGLYWDWGVRDAGDWGA